MRAAAIFLLVLSTVATAGSMTDGAPLAPCAVMLACQLDLVLMAIRELKRSRR